MYLVRQLGTALTAVLIGGFMLLVFSTLTSSDVADAQSTCQWVRQANGTYVKVCNRGYPQAYPMVIQQQRQVGSVAIVPPAAVVDLAASPKAQAASAAPAPQPAATAVPPTGVIAELKDLDKPKPAALSPSDVQAAAPAQGICANCNRPCAQCTCPNCNCQAAISQAGAPTGCNCGCGCANCGCGLSQAYSFAQSAFMGPAYTFSTYSQPSYMSYQSTYQASSQAGYAGGGRMRGIRSWFAGLRGLFGGRGCR